MIIRDLPVYGGARPVGSPFGHSQIFASGPVCYTERPPYLTASPGAYACYIEKELMAPRFQPGEIIFVDPTQPVVAGDYVVLVPTDSECGVAFRHLLQRSRELCLTAQLNPHTKFEDRARDVAGLHRIVGSRVV